MQCRVSSVILSCQKWKEMQSDYLHLHPTNSNLVPLCFGAIGRVLGILGKLFWPKNDPKMLPYVSRLPTIMSRFRHLSVSQNASGSPFVFTYQTPFMSPLTVKTKPTWILAAATCFCWLKYRSSLYCRKKRGALFIEIKSHTNNLKQVTS